MKRHLLLLIILFFTIANFSQQTHIQIKTNNPNIYTNGVFGQNYGSNTSDSGLNLIFSNNQISQCYQASHPIDNVNIIFAICPNANLQNFTQNLLDYDTLVTKVSICPLADTFGDVVITTLLTESIGIPNGIDNNGIVTTNDTGLSQIFQNYNVTHFGKTYPTSSQQTRTYTAMCDCNVSNLKASLLNYNTIVESAEYDGVAFLSIYDYNINNTSIYPNPFSLTFTIETKEAISNYSIFDISGKKLMESESKNELENQSSKLNSGIFFLKILFQNGKTGNYKLVKK